MDDQIRVGDVVSIGDKGGLVERITLRLTVLRDLSGNVHYIRNGKIDIVTNMTKDYSRYVFDIGVAYREDVDEVIEVLESIDEEMRGDEYYGPSILEPLEILGLDRFGDSAVIVRARTKTKPIKQWEIGREFNRRIKKRFDELDIEIPFPHQTIYFGVDKDGGAPPLHVAEKAGGEA
jgi:small conductance mechanosensitive channel